MSYEQALNNAYNEISNLTDQINFSVRLLNDNYLVDLGKKGVFLESCNVPAKEYVSILVLHYLIQKLKLKVLPRPAGVWINFRQLEGGDNYYPAFKKRTIDIVTRKFGDNPPALLETGTRFGAKRITTTDVGIIIEPFENISMLIEIFKGDEEFPPEANILFDGAVPKILCTEDIVVLTEFVTHAL